MSKILIIEDDENILELEKDYIEASNMEAQGATNGNDGLELALNNDYDLILLDVCFRVLTALIFAKKSEKQRTHPLFSLPQKEKK